MYHWLSLLSIQQRFWLFGTIAIMVAIVGFGILMNPYAEPKELESYSIDMSISDIAPQLEVTGKALARELNLPLDVSKKTPLSELDVKAETLQHTIDRLLSHRDNMLKYYLYAALVLGGVVYLTRLGRPDLSGVEHRRKWFPRTPYIISLMVSVIVAGFLLGKSPNPMEGAVKVFKSMVGLYPDPTAKAAALFFFVALAIAGNKVICGWACPFGALEELIYSIPILKRIKNRKLPFVLTNTIRAGLFVVMLLFLFGIIGGRKGTVIYHYLNPFNLFNSDFETISISLTIILALLGSIVVYRPFCQFICPFGFISWIAEYLSIFRIRINKDRCTQCGACIEACPLAAAESRVYGKIVTADCFSCARCLNVCPFDAIQYGSVFKNDIAMQSRETSK
ncbi:MAG: 4Fe-4S binding protein [Deltaproteobacteria bacterium]|nr:4Fe-4S binding protein [Deltaproteobacteria bacterium]